MSVFSYLGLKILKVISDFLGRPNSLDVKRFYQANRLSCTTIAINTTLMQSANFELIVVSSKKDFELLPLTIPAGIRSLGNLYSGETTIVTPKVDVEECETVIQDLRDCGVRVISEETLIGKEEREALKIRFRNRYGWALQQFLKVAAILKSEHKYQLILDADTILVHQRKWIDSLGRQILFPSWEYNHSYYKLLEEMGIGKANPQFTFVTHHMCMQKDVLVEGLYRSGFKNTKQLLEFVLSKLTFEESPFCIEYELYGQYLFNYRKNDFFLEKWANRNVNRREILGMSVEDVYSKYSGFASISAHDYL